MNAAFLCARLMRQGLGQCADVIEVAMQTLHICVRAQQTGSKDVAAQVLCLTLYQTAAQLLLLIMTQVQRTLAGYAAG